MRNGELKDKLPDLPSTRSRFWDEADTNVIEMGKPKDCKHYFIRSRGKEIVCEGCDIGFYADANTQVREGKIFYRNKRIL